MIDTDIIVQEVFARAGHHHPETYAFTTEWGRPSVSMFDRREAFRSGCSHGASALMASVGKVWVYGDHSPAFTTYTPTGQNWVMFPEPHLFTSPEGYHRVGFHEITHWTSDPSRLDRTTITANRSGIDRAMGLVDPMYAREEAVAEMGSLLLGSMFPEVDVDIEGSAHYIAAWVEDLDNVTDALEYASREASRAVEYLLNQRVYA